MKKLDPGLSGKSRQAKNCSTTLKLQTMVDHFFPLTGDMSQHTAVGGILALIYLSRELLISGM